MADQARELIRAAQAAELRGDRPSAVGSLRRAAQLYQQRGSRDRALQLLRNASRLAPSDAGLAREVEALERAQQEPRFEEEEALTDSTTLESSSDSPSGNPPVVDLDDEETSHEDSAERRSPEETRGAWPVIHGAKTLSRNIERTITLAPPSLDAWCSFCCRPAREVGQLVAGPAAAYLCAGCVVNAGRLLGVRGPVGSGGAARAESETEADAESAFRASVSDSDVDSNDGVTAPWSVGRPQYQQGSEVSTRKLALAEGSELVGQREAIAVLDLALRLDARVVLLLGPEGSGKSTYLRALAASGRGVYVDGAEPPANLDGQRLLWDNIERRSPAEVQRFLDLLGEDRERKVIVALRGEIPQQSLNVRSDEVELEIHSTQALLEATSGLLPIELAEAVQVVASFRSPTEEELQEIGRRLLERRAPPVQAGDEVLSALAEQAAGSGRGGREMEALIDRIPAGTWRLTSAGVPTQRRSKPKKRAPAPRAQASSSRKATRGGSKKKGATKKGGAKKGPGRRKKG